MVLKMKYILLLCFQLCVFFTFSQKPFEPIPDSLKSQYKFDLKKNFFKSETEFIQFLKEFDQKKTFFNLLLKKTAKSKNLEALTLQLSSLEFDFRKMDLYLFLQYATDLTNQKASAKEDSIYDIMATERSKYLKILKTASESTISNLLARPSMRPFNYYIQKNINNKTHELSEENKMILAPFNYLRNGQFYREILNELPTDTIYTANEKLDLFNDMAKWQNHDVAEVREEGESKLYKSYATASVPLGFKYIEMIKGLNAFARAKKYEDLIDENCDKMALSKTVLESVFNEIGKNAHIYKTNSNENLKEIGRYVVSDASKLILQSMQDLGRVYHNEASKLLNPKNGRMDIVGGPNRLPLQGAASVYPIGVSTFYAQNYEGYYIDIMLLAHEAGHAIQASLMHQNKVSLLNASGPAYFTESFGKFNEILVAHTLIPNSAE